MPESNIFEKYAELRSLFPDDIERIQADEIRVKKLLQIHEYSQLETTKELLALCRIDVVNFRRSLATSRELTEAQRHGLWSHIDARMWFIEMVSKDVRLEIEQIEMELDRELTP
jgi:hypothetical protein